MRPRSVFLVPLLLCSLTLTRPAPAAEGDWEQTSDKDGVQVWKREDPGSPFHGIKGSGEVKAPPVVVAQVLLDEARSPEWIDSLAEARVVQQAAEDDYIEYNRVDMPWPVRDREFLPPVHMSLDEATGVATIKSEPFTLAALPPKPKTIRGTLRAIYVLEPLADGAHTRLTVEIHSDPGGWLPAWLVNFFQKDWANETIAGIRRQTAKTDLTRPDEFKVWLARFDARRPPPTATPGAPARSSGSSSPSDAAPPPRAP
ncbi:MAG: hypothetical protein JST92_01375 [Deltaproteobacteria bacterium]|nr:hypothetical protein [Deltaproteobacteria bacterium]